MWKRSLKFPGASCTRAPCLLVSEAPRLVPLLAQRRDGKPRPQAPDESYLEKHEKDDNDLGWWEVPEQRSMQAYAIEALEPWQEKRLESAYALEGRRKMKVRSSATAEALL